MDEVVAPATWGVAPTPPTGPPKGPPKLVRQYTGVFNAIQGDLETIGHLVAQVLSDCGWNDVDRDAILVEDKSGHGGSKTYKVTGPGMEPPVVAVHARSQSSVADPIWERRMEAAATELARCEVAPRRFAQGGDWFIEAWEGKHIGKLQLASELTDGNTSVDELAQLMAKIHKVPPDWFGPFREQLGIVKLGLQDAPHGSCVWWPSCRVEEWLTKINDEHLVRMIAAELKPTTVAGARVVTVHGDLHGENVIRTERDGLRSIDLEFTHVTCAVADISYTMNATCDNEAKRRSFAEAYLLAMGDVSDSDAVDTLVLDALSYSALNHFGSILWKETGTFDIYARFTEVVAAAFASADVRRDIIEHGFMHSEACVQLNAEIKLAEYAALEPKLLEVSEEPTIAPLVDLAVNPCTEHWPLNVLAPQLTFTCWLILAEHQSEVAAPLMEDYSLTLAAAECTTSLGDFDISWHQGGIVFLLQGNRLTEKKKENSLEFQRKGLADATWHHMAIRYNSAEKVADLFVDGELVESHSFDVALPVRLTTFSVGEFRENKQVHRYLVESSRFPHGQLRDAKLYARALSPEEIGDIRLAQCIDNAPSFPVPCAVNQSEVSGGMLPNFGAHQTREEDDPELAAVLAMSLETSSGGAAEPSGMTDHKQQMLDQVMAMGFDEASAKNALDATAWVSVEGAIAVLFG